MKRFFFLFLLAISPAVPWTSLSLWIMDVVCSHFVDLWIDMTWVGKAKDELKKCNKRAWKKFKKENQGIIFDKDERNKFALHVKKCIVNGENVEDVDPYYYKFFQLLQAEIQSSPVLSKEIREEIIETLPVRLGRIEKRIEELSKKVSSTDGDLLKSLLKSYDDDIEQLNVEKAREAIGKIEETLKRYPEVQNRSLEYNILMSTGCCNMLLNRKEAYKDFKNAYKLYETTDAYNHMLRVVDTDNVDTNLLTKIEQHINDNDYTIREYFIHTVNSDNREEIICNLPETIKNDIEFKAYMFSWMDKHKEYAKLIHEQLNLYEYSLPEEMNLDNFFVWEYIVSTLLSQFFQRYEFNIFGIYQEPPYTAQHIVVLERIFELVGQSDIRKRLYQLDVYYNYRKYVQTRDSKWLSKVEAEEKSDIVVDRCKTFCYMYSRDWKGAYEFLKEKKDVDSCRCRLYVAFNIMGYVTLLCESVICFLENVTVENIEDIYTIFFMIKFNPSILDNEGCCQAILNAKYENQQDFIFLKTEYELLKEESDVDLNQLKCEVVNADGLVLAMLCQLLAMGKEYDLPINILREKKKQDGKGYLWSTYIEILAYSPKHRCEFYNEAQEFDHKFGFVNGYIANIEGQFALAISDFKNALRIYSKLYEHFGQTNEDFFARYIFSLAKNNDTAKIDSLMDELMTFHPQSTHIILLMARILLRCGYIENCLEYLYQANGYNQSLAIEELYFHIALQTEASSIINRSEEKVEPRAWVWIKENETPLEIEAIEDSRFANSIGRKVGDSFYTSDGVECSIVGVGNKYRTFIENIKKKNTQPSNPYRSFKCFSVEGFTGEDIFNLLKELVRTSGKSPQEIYEESKTEYEKMNRSLWTFDNDNVIIWAHDFLFKSFNIYLQPYEIYRIDIKTNYEQGIIKKFVLDPMALFLFAYIEEKTGVQFPNHFVIPGRLEEMLEDMLWGTTYNSASVLSTLVEGNYVTTIKSSYVESLQFVIEWVKNHCEIEVVPESLELIGNNNATDSLLLLADITFLTQRVGYLGISDDWALNKLLNGQIRCVSSECYMRSMAQIDEYQLEKTYLQLSCIGTKLSVKTLHNEYQAYLNNRDNHFEQCMLTIKKNKFNWRTVLSFCEDIYSRSIVLSVDISNVMKMMLALLENMEQKTIHTLKGFLKGMVVKGVNGAQETLRTLERANEIINR